MSTNDSNDARTPPGDSGLHPAAGAIAPATRKLPPSVRLVKPASPAPPPPAPGRESAEHPSTAVRLQIADQIWRYVAHGIVMTDANGIVQCANPAFVAMLHYTVEQEVINRDIRSFLAVATDLDGVIRRLHERCICAKRVGINTRDAIMLPVQITASPVFMQDGRLRNMIFSMDDATADLETEKLRRQTEMQSQAAAVDQARLAAIAELGYALNDPLQTLLGLAEEDQRADYNGQINRVIEIVRQFYTAHEIPPPAESAGAPAPEQPPAPAIPPAETVPDQPTAALTPCVPDIIMVVDDEPMIRRLFDRMLSDAFPGLRIELAENGAQAVDLFSRAHHAVIVIDIMMPEMRGDEAFTRIAEVCARQQWALPHCIFCTGFMPTEAVTAITSNPHHTLLRKPISRKAIVTVMEKLLNRAAANTGA